jgi:uncharacterized membrane protein YoaK (UPF0700 family)
MVRQPHRQQGLEVKQRFFASGRGRNILLDIPFIERATAQACAFPSPSLLEDGRTTSMFVGCERVGLKPLIRGMTINWTEKRVQWLGAILLAAIAGYVDGYGLLFLKTFVSFMSGNTTTTGVTGGQGNFHAAFLSALAIISFVTGSFLGNLISQSRWRHCHRMMFCLIAAGLAVVTGLEWADLRSIPLEIALLAVTMGMVNPVLSKIGVEAVSLTFMTGTLSRIGGHLALAAGQRPLNDRHGPEDSHLTRAAVEASVWCAFLGGAVLSGLAGPNFRTWALLPPCIVMLGLGLVSECAGPSPQEHDPGCA